MVGRRWWRWLGVGVGLLLVLAIASSLSPPGRALLKTALFIPQILPNIPLKPQEWVQGEPVREEVHFPTAQGRGLADLYRPASPGRYGAVLLFLGVNPAGRNDPRVVNLAKALARSGMVVLIPWSDNMTQKRVRTEDLDNLVRAFQYLQGLEFVDPQRVGMGGFCVGASFAAVAAADPRIRDQVAFVNFFGGYYNARDLLKAIASRTRFYNGYRLPWEPDSLTREVFATHLIQSLEDEQERALLRSLFLEGKGSQVPDLSPQGEVVYRLLSGVGSPEEAEALISRLPPKAQAFLDRISPSTYTPGLKAKVLIMHDRADSLVPSEESRRLADALKERGNIYYTEFSFFKHMDPTRPVDPLTFAREVTKLLLHLYNVMREVA